MNLHVLDTVTEKLKQYKYPALILALGVALLLIPGWGTSDPKKTDVTLPQAGSEEFDLEAFTIQMEKILSGLHGAGHVQLLLTLESDGRREYLMEGSQTQNDGSNQTQTQAVIIEQNGNQHPVPVSRSYPRFQGAVALCRGGDSPGVQLAIKEAISALTGLGMDKITVLKSD